MKRKGKIQVDISSLRTFPPAYRPLLRRAAEATINEVFAHRNVSLAVSVVGPARIQKLNRTFRRKNKPTDVLSFPSAKTPGSDFAGDVIICWETAESKTRAFGTTPREEIQRLTIHGVLHLFGYDHETSQQDAKTMFSLQDKILGSLRA